MLSFFVCDFILLTIDLRSTEKQHTRTEYKKGSVRQAGMQVPQ